MIPSAGGAQIYVSNRRRERGALSTVMLVGIIHEFSNTASTTNHTMISTNAFSSSK